MKTSKPKFEKGDLVYVDYWNDLYILNRLSDDGKKAWLEDAHFIYATVDTANLTLISKNEF